jgi:hypothetical protein
METAKSRQERSQVKPKEKPSPNPDKYYNGGVSSCILKTEKREQV